MDLTIEIAQEDVKWADQPQINIDLFTKICKYILFLYPSLKKINKVELSILLTNDDHMCRLNNEFRNQDKPTNVLSFPDNDIHWMNISSFKATDMYLGDIAFGYDTIAREAVLNKTTFFDYFIYLAVHSMLHLIGYDHIDDTDHKAMEEIEKLVLHNLFKIKHLSA